MSLLERDRFFEQLLAGSRSAADGNGRTVLVSGEAGIGKTSLVEQFVRQYCSKSTCLWGECEALFTPRPLGPLYDIAAKSRGKLALLLEQDTPRPTLFAAFLDELHNTTAVTPTVVVIEDIHWADEATLDLIKFLGRRVAHLPVLFIVTYRDNELNNEHPLWSVIGDLPGSAVTRLKLNPLSEQAVANLAQQANRSAEQLYDITGGNPFFVTEVLANDAPGVPLMVRDAVIARLARLSPAARTILELASVVPARTECWLLQQTLAHTSQALEECLTSGMLSLDPTATWVAFRHELARQAIESTLSPLRQQMLHGQVLKALSVNPDTSSQAARLVHHALGTQDGVQVSRYAPQAARQAAAQGAHREAAAQYATALRYVNQFSLAEQVELLEGRAYECYLTNQIEEAEQARQRALQIWQTLGRTDQVGNTLRWLSRLNWFLGKGKEAEQYAARAVELLESGPPTSMLAMAYSNRAQLAMLADNTAEAVEWGERAIKLAEVNGDTETLVHALNNVGTALLAIQDQQGLPYLERSLQLALEHGLEEHVARAYTNLACAAVRERTYVQAERLLQQGLAYCADRNLDSWLNYMGAWLARNYFEQGRWDEAAVEATRVLDQYRVAVAAKIPALVVLGGVRVRRGDPGSQPLLDEALKLALETAELQRIEPVAVIRAEAAWLRGEPEQALPELQRVYELAHDDPDMWRLGDLYFWLWRCGGLQNPPRSGSVAEPFARQLDGEWERAAEMWAQIGCPYEQALSLMSGDADGQRKALAIFEQLGAHPAAAVVRRLLRQQGTGGIPRGPRPSTRINQAGLTARQQEVLLLMAEGLSNAEIANRLQTSLKTINHHVSAVLAKLEVHSRTQAIVTAHQLNLIPNIGIAKD